MAPKLRRKSPEILQIEDPKFVVAIDFGTTFSKAAYVESIHLEPGFFEIEKMVHLITDWPKQEAGGVGKCFKTKTCVWYMPGDEPHTYAMKAWGWEAYVEYKKLVQSKAKAHEELGSWDRTKARSPARTQELLFRQHGYLIDCFKLQLYDPILEEDLPKGLFLHEVISDFLRGMTAHILSELRQKHGRNIFNRDIKWCITVPALWEESHRKKMEDCAEMAGLVEGPLCKDKTASPHDLITVLEPEAASIYCHNTLKLFSNGDKFAVVDLGGGTTDLVTHQSIGRTKRSNVRVKEVAESIGGLCGGVHVDQRFLDYLREKIRTPTCACFREFEKIYPSQVLDMLKTWCSIKATYEGEVECSKTWELHVPRTLAKSWKKSHKNYLQSKNMHASCISHYLEQPADYNQIDLKSSTVKEIFDHDIESILSLIKRRDIDNVDFVVIVGGFSESPYVRKRIMERFSSASPARGPDQQEKRSKIIFPRNPDTAVVRGAVALGVLGEWESFVKSRIAKKTYGFDTTVPFNEELHPAEYLVFEEDTKEELCDHVFEAVIRRGDEVPFDMVVAYNTRPLYREGHSDDANVRCTLYSTRERNPKFVLEKGVTAEATCVVPVPRTVGRKGKEPQLEIRVHFGGTRIRFVVWGKNFSSEKIAMDPVKLSCITQNQLDRRKSWKSPLGTKSVNHGNQKSRRTAVKRERGS